MIAVIAGPERLFPAVDGNSKAAGDLIASETGVSDLISNIQALLQAAAWLEIPVLVSEQDPQGLGVTLPSLAALLPAQTPVSEKRCFAAVAQVDWYGIINSRVVNAPKCY